MGQCLDSIKSQTYQEWEAYVTVDPCDDGTLDVATSAAANEPRINVVANPRRLYSLANLVRSIERCNADPEDIIVTLDGDDWLYNDQALATIATAYRDYDCWMTYGSWISTLPGYGDRWPAYPKDTENFRTEKWLATAVRTWKRWLWDFVNDDDLRDETRQYFRIGEDQAFMFPMIEMCGTAKAKHISDVLMVYNTASHDRSDHPMRDELLRNINLIRSKPPYARLKEKPQVAVQELVAGR